MTPSDLAPRRLARDLMVRPLGVGSGTSRWAPGAVQPDDARLLGGLRRAMEAGAGEDDAKLFDTADSHRCGHAERLIGRVLREYPGHKVQVASKVGRVQGSAPHPYAGPRVRHQLEQTLENLYLDELALYTLESYDFGLGDRYLDPVIEQMLALRDLGLIRAIGLRGPGFRSSVRSIRRFLDLFDRIRPDVVWTQASGLLPLADLGDGEDLGAFAARCGVGLVIASPLAHGALAGVVRMALWPLGESRRSTALRRCRQRSAAASQSWPTGSARFPMPWSGWLYVSSFSECRTLWWLSESATSSGSDTMFAVSAGLCLIRNSR